MVTTMIDDERARRANWIHRPRFDGSLDPKPPERERKLDTAPHEPDWSAWNKWCDARIEAKLADERRFLLDVVGEALGQALAKERKSAKCELDDSIRSLKLELADALTVINELRSVVSAERSGTPIDLPRLPVRRGLN
jgi:hypothetical protein